MYGFLSYCATVCHRTSSCFVASQPFKSAPTARYETSQKDVQDDFRSFFFLIPSFCAYNMFVKSKKPENAECVCVCVCLKKYKRTTLKFYVRQAVLPVQKNIICITCVNSVCYIKRREAYVTLVFDSFYDPFSISLRKHTAQSANQTNL